MDTECTRLMAASLLRDSEAGVGAVVDAVVLAWTQIDRELAPIIGTAGVAAMFRRSLHLCTRDHPVLAAACVPTQRSLDVEPLRALLLAAEATSAAMLGAELLQTFHELLSRMVGPSLTERLLRPVWKDFSGDAPTEDPLP